MNIIPYEKNAKKHPEKHLKALAEIVKRVGWRQPVLVNQKGVIVAGHGRYLTFQKYGESHKLKKVWVIDDKGKTIQGAPEKTTLSEEDEKAYRLADNKLNESEWDMKLVIEDLKDLSPIALDLTGFSSDLLLSEEAKANEVPDMPEKPQSVIGDLYEIGEHRVLCADSTQQEAVSRLCDGKKVDMYLTDPPYNVNYEGKTKDALKIQNDKMVDQKFRTFLKDAFKAADSVMKKGAIFYIWHADTEGYNFRGVSGYWVEGSTVFGMEKK